MAAARPQALHAPLWRRGGSLRAPQDLSLQSGNSSSGLSSGQAHTCASVLAASRSLSPEHMELTRDGAATARLVCVAPQSKWSVTVQRDLWGLAVSEESLCEALSVAGQ
jgi:hypothetical protein